MISYAVVAHTDRIVQATELAHSIGAVISLDDGSKGAGGNHLEAWRLTSGLETEWAAVLEDDALPVPGFTQQAEQALEAAPEPVVSFYLGRTRPVRWQERISRALIRIDDRDPHWLITTHVLHAVAVALHTDLCDDWLDFATDNTLPPDERMTAWCIARGHKVGYAWPSLVDHADGPTLVKHSNTGNTTSPRIAWRTGTRDAWTPASLPM
ncbi:hypothetical protein [Nocardia asiatica]|uniref:hypothetical protein n=1 Tax=Nocardia asiatica TaxID=209252 RepID=UPI0024555451|nr:hypothetical protein [Nocardia asiatica]